MVRTGRSGKKSPIQGPAVTTITFASSSSRDSTRVSSSRRAPYLSAPSTKARCARSARTMPASGWKSTVHPSGTPTGQRLAAPSASSSSYSAPAAASASAELCAELSTSSSRPVQLEQLLARLLLELPPTRECLLRQLDELDLRVRKPNDARPAVARAVLVADVELLEEQDVTALACQRVRSRRAHDPCPDDGDFCLHPGQAMRFRRTPIPSTSSSTTSPRCSQRPSPCSRMQPVPTVPEPRMSPGRR